MIDLNDVQPAGGRGRGAVLPAAEIAAYLAQRIEDLASELIGAPNQMLSTRTQLRFGNKGSIALEIDGPERGRWYDHERDVGGDALTLVESRLGLANGVACAWAMRWLGLDGPHTPGASARVAGRSAVGERTPPLKVEEILAGCREPVGSPVDMYLRSRGISAALPAAIRYRPNAHGRFGALVALATTAAGEIAAVQQIYLTEDGRKAPVQMQKRTNKARDDWAECSAVRLPGTQPVILCEGVETALSLWQATGHEVWACLGIANIGKAPVPAKVPVLVARDGDAAGSPADRQIRAAVTILREGGHAVRVAEPPEGKDFNDVLLEGGAAAVRALVEAASDGATYSTLWRSGLLCSAEGDPRPLLANAIHALRHAPEWQGVLGHDEFATATVARRPPPWAAACTAGPKGPGRIGRTI